MSGPQVDEVIVIGPECFADSEETVICWRGRNYYRLAGDGPPPRPERAIKAEALREAADEWQWRAWANDLPRGANRPALILGMAQRTCDYLRERAERIEAGESS